MDKKNIIDDMIKLATGNQNTSTTKLVYNPATKMFESQSKDKVNPDDVITITPDDAEMF